MRKATLWVIPLSGRVTLAGLVYIAVKKHVASIQISGMDIFVFWIHNVLLSAKLKTKVKVYHLFMNWMNDFYVTRWLPVFPHQEALSEPQWPWLTDHKVMHYTWRCSYWVKHYPRFLWKQSISWIDLQIVSQSWNGVRGTLNIHTGCPARCGRCQKKKKKDQVSWNLMMGDEKVNATPQRASLLPAAHISHESCFVLLQLLWQPGRGSRTHLRTYLKPLNVAFYHLWLEWLSSEMHIYTLRVYFSSVMYRCFCCLMIREGSWPWDDGK